MRQVERPGLRLARRASHPLRNFVPFLPKRTVAVLDSDNKEVSGLFDQRLPRVVSASLVFLPSSECEVGRKRETTMMFEEGKKSETTEMRIRRQKG